MLHEHFCDKGEKYLEDPPFVTWPHIPFTLEFTSEHVLPSETSRKSLLSVLLNIVHVFVENNIMLTHRRDEI